MHEDASRVLNAELTLLAGLHSSSSRVLCTAVNGFRWDLEEKTERGDLEGPVTPREKLDECAAPRWRGPWTSSCSPTRR